MMRKSNDNNPFKAPEGYFESFTEKLFDSLSDEKHHIPEQDGFSVPEDYFDGLHKNIQQKLDIQETKVVQLYPYRKYYFAVASVAAIALLFFGLQWHTDTAPTFDELADSDIETYFDNNEYGLSSYEIAEVLPVDELEINDILENLFNDENVVDYLYENTNDFDELNLDEYE